MKELTGVGKAVWKTLFARYGGKDVASMQKADTDVANFVLGTQSVQGATQALELLFSQLYMAEGAPVFEARKISVALRVFTGTALDPIRTTIQIPECPQSGNTQQGTSTGNRLNPQRRQAANGASNIRYFWSERADKGQNGGIGQASGHDGESGDVSARLAALKRQLHAGSPVSNFGPYNHLWAQVPMHSPSGPSFAHEMGAQALQPLYPDFFRSYQHGSLAERLGNASPSALGPRLH
ncbi:hypothetical protein A4X06_0g5632 [Tilletia controversa]|uniref:Uncharacterized protein n=1 Tax=Tilletia controversa TaxID=13291 RepID=A0A8X7MRE2_9BASI|nr:hypothetical protein CF328_g6752 [Tilletia controversa]KAE8245524.1 hypothetical protein A4X06_0g5632 [Tilletia controversa]